jgi:hypothetical protein
MFEVLWSVNAPVATNCKVDPSCMEAGDELEGLVVTTIEVRAGGVTVRVAVPEIDPELAVITDEPCARDFASPEGFTDATVALAEDQLATEVRSLLEPSL